MSKWWYHMTVYQIYPRSFNDSNGDGIGDLPGVIDKLDYLAWLGVDAVWFSPFFPSPWKDGGYDVADYCDIHPDYGTLNDFDRLLAAATERGIRIILDLVPNHTSDKHTWFLESRSSRDNPKRDWYIWRDAKPDGSPPNNWEAFFGEEGAWEWDELTGQYYLHSFLREQPDLNWRNPEVRAAMYDNIRFWLDRGVAGFRVDVIDIMMKDAQLRDEPPNPNYKPGVNIPRDKLLHTYSAYQDDVHEVIAEMRQVFEAYEDRVFIGELTYEMALEKHMTYFGADNDELMIPFNFIPLEMTLWGKRPTAEQLQTYINRYEAALDGRAGANWVFGNHDVTRLATRVGKQARVYAMLLLTLRGAAFVYQGEELGMESVDVPREKMKDPFGLNVPGYGRDQTRTPMQWDASPNAGFTTPDAEPWLPLADDYETVNVAAQQMDDTSMLVFYRRLLALRRELPALREGGYLPLAAGQPPDVIAYQRVSEDDRVTVLLNLSGEERDVILPDINAQHLLSSIEMDRAATPVSKGVTLRPYEGVLLRG